MFRNIVIGILLVVAVAGCEGKNPLVRNDVEDKCIEIGAQKACGVIAAKGLLGEFLQTVRERTESERISKIDARILTAQVVNARAAIDGYKDGRNTWESVGNIIDEISKKLAEMSQLDY